MQTTHTPGPWSVTTVGSCSAIHPATSENERDDICRVTPHNYHPDGWDAAKAEAEANARLIAAAPDLLAALRHLLEDAVALNMGESDRSGVLVEARTAIAKATGGQS